MKRIISMIFPMPSKDKNTFNNIRAIFETSFSLAIVLYAVLFIYTPDSQRIDPCSSDYFSERKASFDCKDVTIKVINNRYLYTFLSMDISGTSLAINAVFNTIFININAAEEFNQAINDLVKHELEHTNQRTTLGIIGFFSTPKWLIEGSADYIRGKPTIGYCQGISDWGIDSSRQFYFESWAKVVYLLKIKNIPYDELFTRDLSSLLDEDAIKSTIEALFCSLETMTP